MNNLDRSNIQWAFMTLLRLGKVHNITQFTKEVDGEQVVITIQRIQKKEGKEHE